MMRREIFRAESLPVLQNKTFATPEEAVACPRANVVLVQDMETGLIFNAAFDATLPVYDQDYQNEQACSPTFRRHLEDVASVIKRHFGGGSIFEIGCGKGYFLEHLESRGFNIKGVDPAYDGANPNIVRAPFERATGISADGLILRHVLEHIPDPLSFLGEVLRANGGKGTIYIEVPAFEWIVENRAWFDIFYEHVNYFRLLDFERIFSRVYEQGLLFGGQYLYVVADLSSLRTPARSVADDVAVPPDFLSGITRTISVIKNSEARNAIWGAASKGVIFAVYLERAGGVFDAAIDMNPAKQGRYLPCTGLRIWAPEEVEQRLNPGDNVFIMNSNYAEEIAAQSGRRYRYFTVDHDGL